MLSRFACNNTLFPKGLCRIFLKQFLMIFFLGWFPIVGVASSLNGSLGSGFYHTTIPSALQTQIARSLMSKQYKETLNLIDAQLARDPNNTSLLFQKAAIYVDMEQYKNAIDVLNQLLAIQPKNEKAQKLLIKVIALKAALPHNEIGIDDDEAYVSDFHSYWTFSSLHYYRLTDYGIFGGRVNFAKRYGTTGLQYQIEAYPTLFEGAYLNFSFGYANFTQFLYPNYQVVIEPYFTLPQGFEVSAGWRALRSRGVSIYDYTGSLGKYFCKNYFSWFRIYHYTPKSSDLFEFGLRRYFTDKHSYISAKMAIGKAPDILDLAPLNQIIVLSTNMFGIDGSVALTKTTFFKLGAYYMRQVFPSGNVRETTDGNASLIWQF